MSYKVDLTYFKQSGKYYTGGYYISDKIHLFEIFEEVKELHKAQTLPGIMVNHGPFYVSISVPDHPNDHPHLSIPGEWL